MKEVIIGTNFNEIESVQIIVEEVLIKCKECKVSFTVVDENIHKELSYNLSKTLPFLDSYIGDNFECIFSPSKNREFDFNNIRTKIDFIRALLNTDLYNNITDFRYVYAGVDILNKSVILYNTNTYEFEEESYEKIEELINKGFYIYGMYKDNYNRIISIPKAENYQKVKEKFDIREENNWLSRKLQELVLFNNCFTRGDFNITIRSGGFRNEIVKDTKYIEALNVITNYKDEISNLNIDSVIKLAQKIV